MTLFVLPYHWLEVSYSCKGLGFWSVRSFVLNFLVSITMCSQNILYLTVLSFLKNLCSCHCVSCGVTQLLLAENNHKGKKPQPLRCSLCQKYKNDPISTSCSISTMLWFRTKSVFERKYRKVEKLCAEWDSPVTSWY